MVCPNINAFISSNVNTELYGADIDALEIRDLNNGHLELLP